MTAPSRLSLFGQEYHDLLRLALAAPTANPVRVATASSAAAGSLRRKMYEFFASLRATDGYEQSATDADKLILRLDACYLVLEKRITTPESEAILATLSAATPPSAQPIVSPAVMPAALAKLEAIRKSRLPPSQDDGE